MPDPHWFATLAGDVVGPLTPAQLQVFVERGWVVADTPVRHDRMRRFVPASEVVGLLPVVRAVGPPRSRRAGFFTAAMIVVVILAVVGVLAVVFAAGRVVAGAS